ncbi:MAG: hypothetical protein J0L92_03650 [Deltaproteobacteria bacterium]|nr:hypothetical protein [Deltaproteobacteria bacterium]
MTVPSLTITQLDNALGVLPPTAGRILAIVGASSTGTANVPAAFARVRDVVAAFGTGPLVEAAAHAIEKYGRPVLCVRTGQTTDGAASAVTFVGTGTSAVTADVVTTEPLDDYEVKFLVTLGGTIGTGPISFKYSLDGGRTMSATKSLGTANTYTIPESGVTIDFAAGTLVTGDVATFRTTAPAGNAAEVGAALDALKLTATDWGMVEIVGAIDATLFDAIETKIASIVASGKDVCWIGSARIPGIGESDATYQASIGGVFASKTSTYGALTAGAVEMTSSVSARRYLRPVSMIVAPRENSFSEEINSADIKLGPIGGISIVDSLGNPRHHDEAKSPGLDDARFYVLRTWERRAGVFVNRPRLLCPTGSDFQLLAHRRVMNLALQVLRSYFEERLNSPILVDRTSGFILESEALAIEAGANARLAAVLLSKPKASDAHCVVARNENLLSTKNLSADARVVPLAYAESVSLGVGFTNPALNVVAV